MRMRIYTPPNPASTCKPVCLMITWLLVTVLQTRTMTVSLHPAHQLLTNVAATAQEGTSEVLLLLPMLLLLFAAAAACASAAGVNGAATTTATAASASAAAAAVTAAAP